MTRRFDIDEVRAQFPALQQQVHGKPLVYLDSAATSLKPKAVIDAVTKVYTEDAGNIHRAVHLLSQRATQAFEDARKKVATLLGVEDDRQIVFLRGVTEAINLVARGWGDKHLSEGDVILLTGLEHHSNIVPWQMLAQRTGARIEVVDITDSGEVPLEDVLEKLHTHRPKLVAMSHVSNALGTVLPLAEVTRAAHEIGAVVLADGAQAAPHLPVNLAELDVDFYCFSGHKLYGPTGSGVLFGKYDLLAEMDPYQGGGDMIRSVTFEETLYAAPPARFEAGTPDIAAAIGLGAAVDFVLQYGMETLARREQELLAYGTEALASIGGLRIVGTAAHKVGVLGFVMEGAHPHDIGTIVDAEGVAIRTGHHCAQPVMDRFGLPATARASLGIYNSTEDIDRLVDALRKVKEIFG